MFWDNFIELCNTVDKSANAVCKELKLSNATATHWKKGATPNSTTLAKIATYFGVTPEYLTREGTKEMSALKIRNGSILDNKKLRMIPLFESVSAGFGAYADSRVVEYYPCYIDSDAEAEETLCIRVQGNSMFPKIEDGDIIQVRKQTSVDSGSIAVVLIGGEEGYVKKVNYGEDWIELISLNENYPPMRFEGEDVTKIQVVGIVKKVIKEI